MINSETDRCKRLNALKSRIGMLALASVIGLLAGIFFAWKESGYAFAFLFLPIAPLVCGYVIANHPLLFAMVLNAMVTVGVFVYNWVLSPSSARARALWAGNIPWGWIRPDLEAIAFGMAIGVLFAQTAWFTILWRRAGEGEKQRAAAQQTG